MKTCAMILAMLGVLSSAQFASAQAVARAITQNDFKNLQVFMEAASAESGKLPDRATIMAALKMEKGAANLVKAIEDGSVILTGTTSREEVWAYEKIGPEKGGLILTSNGVEKLSAAEIKKRLGK
jgi:hypothetical protein